MRRLLAFLTLLLLLAITPVASEEPKPFLGVFCTIPGFDPSNLKKLEREDWVKFHPDLFVESTKFTKFADFINQVVEKSGDRPIIIDITCHGGTSGLLSTTISGDDICSVGYLLNRIERGLNGRKVTVIGEFCFPSICVSKSTYVLKEIELKNYHIESYHKQAIDFPFYGETTSVNYNNLVFLQYYYNMPIFLHDLRTYIGINQEPDESKQTDLSLRSLLAIFRNFL